MYMKKNILVFVALLTLAVTATRAAVVDSADAELVARHFWNAYRDKGVAEQHRPMTSVDLGYDGMYFFLGEGRQGFVVVAADDAVQPILAYAFRGTLVGERGMSRELTWWFDGYQSQIASVRDGGYKADGATEALWQGLRRGAAAYKGVQSAVDTMLTTKWDQDSPYNDLCPTGQMSMWGGRTYPVSAATGCVATAMAQVMNYHQWPVRGTGKHSFRVLNPNTSRPSSTFDSASADFGATVYDWDNMLDTYSSVSPQVAKTAVATLMYHCGVAVDMMYGSDMEGGSGAMVTNMPYMCYGSVINGAIKYFGYSSNMTGILRKDYDDTTWTSYVHDELVAARPVIYAGGDATSGGHCFVCDGCDTIGKYHFNWGWSGAGDGFFTLNRLAPGVGGIGGGTGTYNFTAAQEIVLGFQPASEELGDSLCIIRQFPYEQNFEVAPTCWESESSYTGRYSYGLSWQLTDTTFCLGKYSAHGFGTGATTSTTESLYSPYITTPGHYTVTWKSRAVNANYTEDYAVLFNDSVLFSDQTNATEWEDHEATFTVGDGDTLRLLFRFAGVQRSSKGILIDDIVISQSTPVAIDEVEKTAAVSAYPNPTSGVVTLRAAGAVRHVEVYDNYGRQLERLPQQRVVNLGCYPQGIYILRVVTDEGVTTLRVVRD